MVSENANSEYGGCRLPNVLVLSPQWQDQDLYLGRITYLGSWAHGRTSCVMYNSYVIIIDGSPVPGES